MRLRRPTLRLRRPTLLDASKVAVLAWTSHAHWSLAGQLGMPDYLRLGLPVAVDAYFLAALSARRDRAPAIALAAVTIAGAHAASQYDLTHREDIRAVVAGALGVVLALTLWRVFEVVHGERTAGEQVADLTARLATQEAAAAERLASTVAEHARQVAKLRGELAAATANPPAPAGEPIGEDDPDSGDADGHLMAKLAGEISAGRWRGSWRDVQKLDESLSPRQAQRALAKARKVAGRHGLTVASAS